MTPRLLIIVSFIQYDPDNSSKIVQNDPYVGHFAQIMTQKCQRETSK